MEEEAPEVVGVVNVERRHVAPRGRAVRDSPNPRSCKDG